MRSYKLGILYFNFKRKRTVKNPTNSVELKKTVETMKNLFLYKDSTIHFVAIKV